MSKFSFTFTAVDAIPKAVRRAPTNTHPFPWDEMSEAVKASGKLQMFAVPKAYWIEERGMDAEKYNAGLMREKIRSTFKAWQSRDEKARAGLGLAMITKGDDIEVYLQPASEEAEAPTSEETAAPEAASTEPEAPTSEDAAPKKTGKKEA